MGILLYALIGLVLSTIFDNIFMHWQPYALYAVIAIIDVRSAVLERFRFRGDW